LNVQRKKEMQRKDNVHSTQGGKRGEKMTNPKQKIRGQDQTMEMGMEERDERFFIRNKGGKWGKKKGATEPPSYAKRGEKKLEGD